jgi:hypothetical protein
MLTSPEQPYGHSAQEALSDEARSRKTTHKRKRGGQGRKQRERRTRPPSYLRRENKRLQFNPYMKDDAQLIEHLNLTLKARHCYCSLCRAVREHLDCDCHWCVKANSLQTQLVCSSCK